MQDNKDKLCELDLVEKEYGGLQECPPSGTNESKDNSQPPSCDSFGCQTSNQCYPWQLTDSKDDCLMTSIINEQINIAGVNLKVFKLLGVHEQAKLVDITGNGEPISSGDMSNYPAKNAFDKYITEWRSKQVGKDVIKFAYIGYDFGPIKMSNGRNRYGIDTEFVKDISTIKIIQGCESKNRITLARVERSEDGTKWYGVSVIKLKDCDGIQTIHFKRSVPSRYWRIRPLAFNGGDNDPWVVRALQLSEYEKTELNNIQDKILFENRDRDYSDTPIVLKAVYNVQEFQTAFETISWFNQIKDTFTFDISFSDCIQKIGRPIVIGDIVVPESEAQYTPDLNKIEKYLEVTDVFWSSSGFTPTWKPLVLKITAKPVVASQETQDVFGGLTTNVDSSGLFDINDGIDDKKYQDFMDISDSIRAERKKLVPEKGSDYSEAPQLDEETKQRYNYTNIEKFDRTRYQNGIDAIPPNGLPYTQGDEFPDTPKDGDYHRLTYNKIDSTIPARLYRYSSSKSQWIYLETDRRAKINSNKPLLDDYILDTENQVKLNEIENKLKK